MDGANVEMNDTCPCVQKEFSCFKNGRPDQMYLHFRWQPLDCQLSRFYGRGFLQKFKGKSIMFVGDSLSRNMWESLICMLYTSVGRTKSCLRQKQPILGTTYPGAMPAALAVLKKVLNTNKRRDGTTLYMGWEEQQVEWTAAIGASLEFLICLYNLIL